MPLPSLLILAGYLQISVGLAFRATSCTPSIPGVVSISCTERMGLMDELEKSCAVYERLQHSETRSMRCLCIACSAHTSFQTACEGYCMPLKSSFYVLLHCSLVHYLIPITSEMWDVNIHDCLRQIQLLFSQSQVKK